jgi:hypothetical protein
MADKTPCKFGLLCFYNHWQQFHYLENTCRYAKEGCCTVEQQTREDCNNHCKKFSHKFIQKNPSPKQRTPSPVYKDTQESTVQTAYCTVVKGTALMNGKLLPMVCGTTVETGYLICQNCESTEDGRNRKNIIKTMHDNYTFRKNPVKPKKQGQKSPQRSGVILNNNTVNTANGETRKGYMNGHNRQNDHNNVHSGQHNGNQNSVAIKNTEIIPEIKVETVEEMPLA